MKGWGTDMKHHVALATLLTLSVVLGGHLPNTDDIASGNGKEKQHELTLISSKEEEPPSRFKGHTKLLKPNHEKFEKLFSESSESVTELYASKEDEQISPDHELSNEDLAHVIPKVSDNEPSTDSDNVIAVNRMGLLSPNDYEIVHVPIRPSSRSRAISGFHQSKRKVESHRAPFSPSPIDNFASSIVKTVGHQGNNAITTSFSTSAEYLNSSYSVGSDTNTRAQNTATISQDEFNSVLSRYKLDALQATKIAERLGIAGTGVSEFEREIAYNEYDLHSPSGYNHRPLALPLGRITRTIPHGRRRADPSKATRRLFFGDPSLCYSGTCEFFLFCWLGGGLIDGGCGGFLFACCTRPSQRGNRGETYRDDSVGLIPVNYGPIRNDNTCGLSSSSRVSAQRRVVGGTEAGFGSFPWQAYIRIGSSRCGGSLINQYHVVTAGHCVARARPSQIRVTLGDYVLNSNKEPLAPEIYGASDIKVHPNFKFTPQADRFDVAVITLNNPVQYQPHIQPICLPEKGSDWLGSYAWAAGWGALQAGSRIRPKTLQVVDVPIIDSRLCEDWHRQKGINVIIYDEMMCAGYKQGGKDSCQGDSGGPLMIQDSGRWYLVGIVSAGYSCAQGQQPGIYHKVSYTSDWISNAANT